MKLVKASPQLGTSSYFLLVLTIQYFYISVEISINRKHNRWFAFILQRFVKKALIRHGVVRYFCFVKLNSLHSIVMAYRCDNLYVR